MSSPINLSSVTVSLCVTCHGVALLGHLAEALDQGLAQLPAAAGPAAPPPGHRYPVSIYNVTLARYLYTWCGPSGPALQAREGESFQQASRKIFLVFLLTQHS